MLGAGYRTWDAESWGWGSGAARGPGVGMHRRGVGAGAIAKKKLAEVSGKEAGLKPALLSRHRILPEWSSLSLNRLLNYL